MPEDINPGELMDLALGQPAQARGEAGVAPVTGLGADSRLLLRLAGRATLGDLVSAVAHDINNPLSIVMGYTELLLKKGTDGASTEQLQIILQQTQCASQIVEDLRSLSRETASRSWLDVTDTLDRVLRLRSYELRVGGISVSKDLPESLPMVLANEYQLSHIFLNLVTNAEHAVASTKDGGILTVSVASEGQWLRVTIRDSGPGIPPEHLDKVVEPFFTTMSPGAGSGLSLCI